MPLKCNGPQIIFIIPPKCLPKLPLSQWMASSATQLPNTETWEWPGVFIPLWFPHLSNHQVLAILFLLNLSPSVYSSLFPWLATALIQVLVISYFDFCSLITDQVVSLTLGLHLSNPFSIQQPDPSVPCFKFSGSPLQSRWNQTPYNDFQAPFWSGLCILSRIMPQSDSTHTNNSPPLSLTSSICYNCPLTHSNQQFGLLAVLWTCQCLSRQGLFIWHSFCLESSFTVESQGLFLSWLSAFYSAISSLKLSPTSLFKNVGYVSQLQQTPPTPCSVFLPLHFSPSIILCNLCIFCISCKNISCMKAQSLMCSVLWYISSVLNMPGRSGQIGTLHASSCTLSSLASDRLLCITAPPLTVCMTLEKWLHPSMPQFSHLCKRENKLLRLWDDIWNMLRTVLRLLVSAQ